MSQPDSSSKTTPRFVIVRQLYISFFRVGLFTFGGGYAMLPLLEREAIERRKWATRDEILDMYALAQIAPGVISVNTATFLGQRQAGIPGALAATAGMISPSIIVILLVAILIGGYESHPFVMAGFAGVRAGVGGLIVATAWRIARRVCHNTSAVLLTLAAALVATTVHGGAGWAILMALAAGTIRYFIKRRQSVGTGQEET